MTIGYYTGNSVSNSVMRSLSKGGVKVAHINNFQFNKNTPAVFYGILRGTGAAMKYLQMSGKDFHYLDNGYFNAVYMDENKLKDMSGKYRVVRGDMIESMDIEPAETSTGTMNVLLIPPSTYTAFMYDTTPEDWNYEWGNKLSALGHSISFRKKDEGSFDDAVKDFDAVFAFNSISAIRAVELGKAVYTTHGIIRNAHLIENIAPYYDIYEIKEFYKNKQFTLEEIADRGIKCLN